MKNARVLSNEKSLGESAFPQDLIDQAVKARRGDAGAFCLLGSPEARQNYALCLSVADRLAWLTANGRYEIGPVVAT